MENRHYKQPDVVRILELKRQFLQSDKRDKSIIVQIKKCQSLVRFRGDNRHNMAVLQYSEGELLLARRGVGGIGGGGGGGGGGNVFDVRDGADCNYWVIGPTALG